MVGMGAVAVASIVLHDGLLWSQVGQLAAAAQRDRADHALQAIEWELSPDAGRTPDGRERGLALQRARDLASKLGVDLAVADGLTAPADGGCLAPDQLAQLLAAGAAPVVSAANECVARAAWLGDRRVALMVRRPGDPSATALEAVRRVSVWSGVLTLALALSAAVWLSRRLARPIRALSARAADLALRHTGRAASADRNEMRELQNSFTAMTGAMLAQFERLRAMHLDEMQNSLELQRRYALMRLLRDLSTAAHESGTLQQTLERALEDIGGYLDWPIGRVLVVGQARGARESRLHSIWFAPDRARHARFIAACEALPMDSSDRGLIGRARVTGMPHWVTDLSRLDGWRRQEAAAQCGLKSGFVIPVCTSGEGAAFIEFFTDHRVDATAEMVELIEAIHTELWQAGERHRGLEQAGLAAAQERGARGAGAPVTLAAAGIDAAALDNLEMLSSG